MHLLMHLCSLPVGITEATSSGHQQHVLKATVYPLDGGSSGVVSKNVWREDLKLDNVGLRVVCAGVSSKDGDQGLRQIEEKQ